MYLYTARLTERPAELPTCNEGSFEWIAKSDVLGLQLWEGDKYFLERLLAEASTPFEMTLRYEGDSLVEVERGE